MAGNWAVQKAGQRADYWAEETVVMRVDLMADLMAVQWDRYDSVGLMAGN